MRIKITHNGKKQSVYQWAAELNMSVQTIYTRLDRGWSGVEALIGRPRADGSCNSGPRKNSTAVIFKGVKYLSLGELAKATGVSYNTIYMRHYRGVTNAYELVYGSQWYANKT